jgi:hypothetical protein
MLAAVALIVRPVAQRIAVAAFAVFVVCVVLGLPPVFGIFTSLPGFSAAHNERMLIFFLLCLALLAGWGLDDLTASTPITARRRRVMVWSGAAILVLPVVWMAVRGTLTSYGFGTALGVAWGFQAPPALPSGLVNLSTTPAADIIRMSALLQWLPLAGLGLMLIAARLGALPERLRRALPAPGRRWLAVPLPVAATVAVAFLLLTIDLFRANMGFNPAIPVSHARVPATGAIRFLQSERPDRYVGVSTNITFQPLPADTGMYFGISDARGYDYPAEKHYDTLWRRNVAPGVPDFAQPIETAAATPAALRALDLLSVHDLLTDPRQPPLRARGLQVAYRGADAIVYRNADSLPRVFLAASQQPVSGDGAALAAATAPGFDRRHVVVTERAVPGLPAGRSPGSPGVAQLESYAPERVVVQATARRPTMLVLTDDVFPGWKATVDGRPATIDRVDYLLRGVPLAPGPHRVVFRYQPASFRVGWIISLVSLAAVLVTALLGWRGHRTGAGAGNGPRKRSTVAQPNRLT